MAMEMEIAMAMATEIEKTIKIEMKTNVFILYIGLMKNQNSPSINRKAGWHRDNL